MSTDHKATRYVVSSSPLILKRDASSGRRWRNGFLVLKAPANILNKLSRTADEE